MDIIIKGQAAIEVNLDGAPLQASLESQPSIEVNFGGTTVGTSTSVDPELLEAYLPMSRDFSDDFNNDFAR